jgi:heme A synthase
LLDFILMLHEYNVYLVIIAATIAGILGMVLYFTKRSVTKQWRVMLVVTLVLGLLQAAFGLTMVAMGQKPGGGTGLYYLHYVYGGIVALSIPLVWLSFTTNGQDKRKDMLFYSIATLVMVAAAVRAWMTGPVVFHLLP